MVSKIRTIILILCFVVMLPFITDCSSEVSKNNKVEETNEIDKSKQDAEGIIKKYLEEKYPGITVYSVYRPYSSGLALMTNEDGSWDYEAIIDDYLSHDGDADTYTFIVYRDENLCVTKIKAYYRSKTQEISDEFEP